MVLREEIACSILRIERFTTVMLYNYAACVFTFMIEIVSTILGENSHDLWLGI